MKDYSKTPVPGNCPICYNTVFGRPIMRFGVLNWETMRQRWQCQECLSIFDWEPSDRIVGAIETHFPRGVMGNIDVQAINLGMGNNWIDPKLPDEFDPPSYDHSRNFES